jgi:hypothetical protein
MEEQRLSALFEARLEQMETNLMILRNCNTRLQKDIISKQEAIAKLLSENSQLRSQLEEVNNDLRILLPRPFAKLYLQKCINHQIACNDAVNLFNNQYSSEVINSDPVLTSQLQELKNALKASIIAQASAAFLCKPPPTLASVLWLIAKNGHSKDLMRCLNLNRATRLCDKFPQLMKELKNNLGKSQLCNFSERHDAKCSKNVINERY